MIFVSLFLVFLLRFFGYIFYKFSRHLTRPLGGTKGSKGLVAYAKCNRDNYDSELGSWVSFYFVLLGDEQRIGVGAFVMR